MAFKKGQVANPAGRPKGSKNKRDIILSELTAAAISEGMMPLEFFLLNMRNPKVPLGYRIECAKAAAPYVHKRMPQEVAVEAKVNHVHRGGVMEVPPIEAPASWEQRAAASQAALKREVVH